MPRIYTGDITGDFWGDTEQVDAPEQFGAHESKRTVRYSVTDNDQVRKRLLELFARVGLPENVHLNPSWVHDLAAGDGVDSEEHELYGVYSALELGLKVFQHVEEHGHCNFEVVRESVELETANFSGDGAGRDKASDSLWAYHYGNQARKFSGPYGV